jgi:hypothetical protein
MMNMPERIDINPEQLAALLKRAKDGLENKDYEIIKAMADTLSFLSQVSDEKAVTIKRLLRMLFGDKTEKAEKLLGKQNHRSEMVLPITRGQKKSKSLTRT